MRATCYRSPAAAARSVDMIRKIGAEHIIVSTDCGQSTNLYPSDCLVVSARELRARGITQREIDLMYKVNPAKLLGLRRLRTRRWRSSRAWDRVERSETHQSLFGKDGFRKGSTHPAG